MYAKKVMVETFLDTFYVLLAVIIGLFLMIYTLNTFSNQQMQDSHTISTTSCEVELCTFNK